MYWKCFFPRCTFSLISLCTFPIFFLSFLLFYSTFFLYSSFLFWSFVCSKKKKLIVTGRKRFAVFEFCKWIFQFNEHTSDFLIWDSFSNLRLHEEFKSLLFLLYSSLFFFVLFFHFLAICNWLKVGTIRVEKKKEKIR